MFGRKRTIGKFFCCGVGKNAHFCCCYIKHVSTIMTNRTTLKVTLTAMAFMLMVGRTVASPAEPIVSDSSSVDYSNGALVSGSAGMETPIALKLPHDDLYQHPYSMWRSCPNWKRIWQNTAVLFGAGFATLGVLELLPENTTAWNKASQKGVPFSGAGGIMPKAGLSGTAICRCSIISSIPTPEAPIIWEHGRRALMSWARWST